MTAAYSLTEADLHGLVDGRLEPSRRAEALRTLAASPADRARVDAWQEQNDLIKSAFHGVDKEAIPVPLRLVAPPTLHCVPSPVTALRPAQAAPPRGGRVLAGLITSLVVAAGLGGSWVLLQQSDDGSQLVDLQLRGTIDASLASLTADAVATDAGQHASKHAANRPDAVPAPLPTTKIPDLTPAGFTFTSAESRSAEPASLLFHYRNAASDQVVVSIARAPQAAGDSSPIRIGRTFSWHRGDNAFAVAGTVRSDRLRAIAMLLQGSSVEE